MNVTNVLLLLLLLVYSLSSEAVQSTKVTHVPNVLLYAIFPIEFHYKYDYTTAKFSKLYIKVVFYK